MYCRNNYMAIPSQIPDNFDQRQSGSYEITPRADKEKSLQTCSLKGLFIVSIIRLFFDDFPGDYHLLDFGGSLSYCTQF